MCIFSRILRQMHQTEALWNMSKNYYEILGIEKNASKEEIKKAFYRKAKIYHPDVNHASNAADVFRLIQEAYQTLYDDDKRGEYDYQQIKNTSSCRPNYQSGNYQGSPQSRTDSGGSNYAGSHSNSYTNTYSNSSPYRHTSPDPGTYYRSGQSDHEPVPKRNRAARILRNILLSPVYFVVAAMEKIVIILGGIFMVIGVVLFVAGIVMGVYKLIENAPLNPDILSWFLVSIGGILIFLLPSIIIKGITAAKNYLHDIFFDD